MINYTEIKEKYPKAFEAFCEWDGANPIYEHLDELHFSGQQFEFFDEHGILINICALATKAFLIGIGNTTSLHPVSQKTYRSRAEAEEVASKEAFEILEKRLTGL